MEILFFATFYVIGKQHNITFDIQLVLDKQKAFIIRPNINNNNDCD